MFTLDPVGKVVAVANGGKKYNGKFISICDEEAGTGFQAIADTTAGFEIVPTVNYVAGKKKKLEPCRDVVFVCGTSGMGKSTMLASYARKFQRMFKNQPVFMISRKQSDPAYAGIKLSRPILDESLASDPIDIQCDDIPNTCLFVFDDYDTFPDVIQKPINKLLADILETGRAKNIYCAISSHLITKPGHHDNSILYNEMHRLVFSPRGGNRPALMRVLENQIGLTRKQAEQILEEKSRWVTIGKSYPQYMVVDHGITML